MKVRRGSRFAGLGLSLIAAFGTPASAQDTVHVTIPAGVDFYVTDVSRETAGAPGATRVAFSALSLGSSKAVRLSLQADASTFEPPGGPRIEASSVSWVVSGMSNGFASPGTLSSSSYAVVFQSGQGVTSAHADLAWVLAPPPAAIRAGVHQLTIRWKVESITP